MNIINLIYILFVGLLIIDFSVVEWIAHYVMHKPKWCKIRFVGPLLRLIVDDHNDHHRGQSAEFECNKGPHIHHSHSLPQESKFETCLRVTQFWWVGLFLAFLAASPFLILESIIGFQYNFSILAAVLFYIHYGNYELLHNSIHRGKSWQRSILTRGLIAWFIARHEIHHRKGIASNYTGLFTFADYIFGTEWGVSKTKILAWRMITSLSIVSFLIAVGIQVYT